MARGATQEHQAMQDPDRQNPNGNGRHQKQQGRMPQRSAAVQGPDQLGATSTNRSRKPEGERPQEPLGDYGTIKGSDVARRGPGRSG